MAGDTLGALNLRDAAILNFRWGFYYQVDYNCLVMLVIKGDRRSVGDSQLKNKLQSDTFY